MPRWAYIPRREQTQRRDSVMLRCVAGSSPHCLSSEERAAERLMQLGNHTWFLLSHTVKTHYIVLPFLGDWY